MPRVAANCARVWVELNISVPFVSQIGTLLFRKFCMSAADIDFELVNTPSSIILPAKNPVTAACAIELNVNDAKIANAKRDRAVRFVIALRHPGSQIPLECHFGMK